MNSTTVKKDAALTPKRVGEPVKLLRRIGSATVEITVHFSNTSHETLEDKLLRLIQGSREIEDFVGRGGATERSGCPAKDGRSEAQSATTKREVLDRD